MFSKLKKNKTISIKSVKKGGVANSNVPSVGQTTIGAEVKFRIKMSGEMYPIPDVEDKRELDVKYPLIEPYAFVHIYWDVGRHELVYELHEPVLNEDEIKVLDILEKGIEELINISFIAIKSPEVVIAYLEKNMRVLLREFGIKITEKSFLKLMYYIYRDFVGMNEIEPLLRDYYIEDIECNGVNVPIYIVHRKYGNVRTNVVYGNIKELTGFVEKLAQKCGKYVSYASPLLDGTLPDNSRVNATYTQDVSSRGPTFTIRKFTRVPWTPIHLMQFRTASPEVLAYLWLLIEYEANILIIGAAASGKTTLLNALAFFIPPGARIVSIEDTKEISLLHENWLPSVARAGVGVSNIMGVKHGEVSMFDLLKESFRQRPDYVIVGEVRGKEAFVLFQAMASGHASLSTMHAEDVGTMIRRLETHPINLSASLVESLDAVCLMIRTKVKGKASRRVRNVVEIIRIIEKKVGHAVTNTPFSWDPGTDRFYFKRNSKIFERLITKYGMSKAKLELEFRRRVMLLMKLYQLNITGFKEVQAIINAYYKTPDLVLKKYGIK